MPHFVRHDGWTLSTIYFSRESGKCPPDRLNMFNRAIPLQISYLADSMEFVYNLRKYRYLLYALKLPNLHSLPNLPTSQDSAQDHRQADHQIARRHPAKQCSRKEQIAAIHDNLSHQSCRLGGISLLIGKRLNLLLLLLSLSAVLLRLLVLCLGSRLYRRGEKQGVERPGKRKRQSVEPEGVCFLHYALFPGDEVDVHGM